jgi:hypothetical protein
MQNSEKKSTSMIRVKLLTKFSRKKDSISIVIKIIQKGTQTMHFHLSISVSMTTLLQTTAQTKHPKSFK